MRNLSLSLLSLLIAQGVFASTSHQSLVTHQQSSSAFGFYPIWESGGTIIRDGRFYLGTNGAGVGIIDRMQIGVFPVSYFYRTPNAYFKYRLIDQSNLQVSTQLGVFHLLKNASNAYFSPMYSSRIDNKYFDITLIPAALSATHSITYWLDVHQTATLLTMTSDGPIKDQIVAGYFATAELLPQKRHSVLFHAGNAGIWETDFTQLGASYRYHNDWIEMRFGYFYRNRSTGTQGTPMVSLGMELN